MLGYDALNRLLTSTDPAGGVTRYAYDAKDRLVSVRDPINLTTTYSYDGLGNLTQLASPDTGISTFVPDAVGNVVGATDARGLATGYSYDVLNRQTLAAFAGGSVVLEYDNTATGGAFARGRLTRIADPSGATAYTYDALGRVRTKAQTVSSDASERAFSVRYRYAAGRATGIVYPSGRSVSYAFDAQGRIASIMADGQLVLGGVEYLPFGGVKAWIWANGQRYRRDFDADGRIAALTLGPDTLSYGSEAWTFGYDALNRLTSALLPQGESLGYAYDANGNRKQETRSGATTTYGYPAASNRLQSLAGAVAKNFTYDAAGNLTSNGSATFNYDGRGRLTQTSSGHKYLINGLGQRVAKTGPDVATGTTHYVYDEQGHLIGEYDAAGAVRQELIYLGDIPVASVRPNSGGGVDIFLIYTDHLDTPRLITNQANQRVWEWKTDAFGAGPANEDPSGLGVFSFNLRFPGQYYDVETGLHYNYFRDYDPTVGRYVESDPIGLAAGTNTYNYVGGGPLNGVDHFGLDETVWLPGPGRQLKDGPRNGNWCGGNWGGGWPPSLHAGRDGPRVPVDSLDACCMSHDRCWTQCENLSTKVSRDSCLIGGCDRAFVQCLQRLGDNCSTWSQRPRLGTESDSQFYRDDALRYFLQRIRRWEVEAGIR